jgi:hypothetical protein
MSATFMVVVGILSNCQPGQSGSLMDDKNLIDRSQSRLAAENFDPRPWSVGKLS